MQKEKTLIRYLDRNIEDDIIKNAVTGRISFKQEVERFYGISRHWTIDSLLRPADPKKIGKKPIRLTTILNNLSDRNIKEELTTYESVREDYLVTDTKNRVSRATMMIYPVIVPFTEVAILEYMQSFDITTGLIGIGLLTAGIIAGITNYKTPKPKGNFNEYIHMHDVATKADQFIENTYKPYLLKKLIDNPNP